MSRKGSVAREVKENATVAENEEMDVAENVPVLKKTSSTKKGKKPSLKKNVKADSIPEADEEQHDEENQDVESTANEQEEVSDETAPEDPTTAPVQKPKKGAKKAEEGSESAEEEKMPPKRGKQASKKDEDAEPVAAAPAAEEESAGEEPVVKGKTARKPAAKGKKGKKEEVTKEAEEEKKVEEDEKMEEEEEAAKPAEKGDEEMKDAEEDKEAEDEKEAAKPAPKGRGGKKAAAAPAKPLEKEDEEMKAAEEDKESEEEKPAPKGRGGRKAAAAKPATGEEPETKKQKKEEAQKPAARRKKAAEKDEDEEKEEANEDEEKEEAKEEPKPKGRGRAAKNSEDKVEEEVEPEKPAGRPKRGAAAKAAATAKKIAEEEEEVEVKPKRGAKGAAKKAAEKDDDEEEKPAPKKGGKQPAKGRGKGKKEEAAGDDEDELTSSKIPTMDESEDDMGGKSGVKSMTKSIRRTVQVKGKAAVDPLCTRKASTSHVYESGDLIYDVMLNQTNIGNNNNKFYVIQLLEDDKNNHYSVWNRWGRVGYDGQNKLTEFGTNLQGAIREFASKFEAKTKNEWPTAFADFHTYPNKYTMIEMDYGVGGGDAKIEKEQEEEEQKSKAVSKLDERVQKLMHLMCSIRNMTLQVQQLEFDAEKSPLGKLTQQQIKEGYACLAKVEQFIVKKQLNSEFRQAVNEYYTKVPHAVGFRPPTMISTPQLLKQEIDLLDLLSGIEYAIKTMKEEKREEDVHPVDRHYASLKCGLSPIEKTELEYQLVEEYLAKTHGQTHAMQMKMKNAFKIEREGEDDNDQVMDKIGNRKLLWHGSRLSNFFGILSQGLRIAPPEAPCTGYMFGKGVYFADMASKSGNYCNVSEDGQTGFLLLAEVALGEENQLRGADYNANKLPSGKHSTWGLGKTMPDPAQNKQLNDKVVVPCGSPIDNPIGGNMGLLYNEFIVYDTQQIRMRYLLEVEFNFY